MATPAVNLNFLKAGLIFSVSTGTKLLANLFVLKLFVSVFGSEGFGRLGQLMSLVAVIGTFAGGGILTGLIKYVAEFRNQSRELARVLSTASLITLVTAWIVAALVFIFAPDLSRALVGDVGYESVIKALALAQILLALNNYSIGIVNGQGDVRGHAMISIAGTLLGVGSLYGITLRMAESGAVYGPLFIPVATSFFCVGYGVYRGYFAWKVFKPRYDRQMLGRFAHYAGLFCVSACALPLGQMVVRNGMGDTYGWSEVGYWQGVLKISDAYLAFVIVVLYNYYLPRLSAATSRVEVAREVRHALAVVVPLVLACAAAIYGWRDSVIQGLFSPEFVAMRDFFCFQLVGDVFKISAMTIVYIGLAKGMIRLSVFFELGQAFLFIAAATVFLRWFGPLGVTYGYAAGSAIYFLIAWIFFRRYQSISG